MPNKQKIPKPLRGSIWSLIQQFLDFLGEKIQSYNIAIKWNINCIFCEK